MSTFKGFVRIELDERAIVDAYLNKHESLLTVGKRFGVSDKTIENRLKKNGIAIRTYKEAHHRKIMSTDIPRIRSLYEEGKTQVEVGELLGVSGGVISTYLKKMGISRTSEESKRLRGTTSCGDKNHHWKGGRRVSDGYVYIQQPTHPKRDSNGYISEHRAVWEEHHGKRLPKGYVIQHLNGIKNDNRPINLVAMKQGFHAIAHRELNTEQYKKRIRQLEIENRQLRKALENSQMIFTISEN